MAGRREFPNLDTILLDFPWVVVRLRCHYCEKTKDARLAALASEYGDLTKISEVISIWRSRCPYSPEADGRKPQKYSSTGKCGAHVVDIGGGPPPDLPPDLMTLRVVGGNVRALPKRKAV